MADAIIAKAKAIYGHHLTAADYNNLMHRKSVGGVVAFLKENERYRKLFSDTNETQVHRGQVEQMLSKEVFELYLRLCRFMLAEKDSFCYFLIKEREIKEIISALVYVASELPDGYVKVMPAYFMDYASFDLMALANAKSLDDILNALSQTHYYKLLKPLLSGKSDEEPDLEECGMTLYVDYINWAFAAIERGFKGDEEKELKENFLKQIDLDNILTCYRMKISFESDSAKVKKSLKPFHYRINEQRFDEILSGSDAGKKLIEMINRYYFKNNIEIDSDFLEVAIRRFNYSYYSRQFAFATSGITALYSFMVLLEVERTNLLKIIEGIRYGLEPAEIEKLVVY